MGNAHVSRRAVVRAGEVATEVLEQQRQLFQEQLKVVDRLERTLGSHTTEIESLKLSRENLRTQLYDLQDQVNRFNSMNWKERVRWVMTGKTPSLA